MASVDEGAWDGAQAMSDATQADDPAAAYAAICAGRRDGDPALQSTWALPHHAHPGDPPNADGVRNSLARLPQTKGLINEQAAQKHLDAHLADIRAYEQQNRVIDVESDIQVRDASLRQIDMRIMPWGMTINSNGGTESFARGAFAGTDPKSVVLVGPEHERKFALGHDGSPTLARHPVGKGLSLEERDDGAYMTFKVANTQSGDEILALVADGIANHASIEFVELPGGTLVENRKGRRHRTQQRVRLEAVSTTYRPAYEQAEVLAVRSEEEAEVPETTVEAPAVGADATNDRIVAALEAIEARSAAQQTAFLDRVDQMQEQARASFEIPSGKKPEESNIKPGEWMSLVLRSLTGERIPQAEMRAAEDVITSDNIGVVPPAYLTELIGVIDPSRPFLSSTRQLNTPSSGMQLVVPVITQRPTVDIQSTEKSELSHQTTKISTKSFDMVTKGGYGDISLQLLKRADRSFLDLYLQLLAEAYAIEAEDEAVRALLDAAGGIGGGSSLDPNNLLLGDAYTTSFDAIRRPPDTIWLSTEAIAAFIDAKADTTNQPLYPGLTPSATAGGGIRGTISGLNAVHTPALDAHGAFAIVGPSSGFAWAEDGTYTLQVDVPAKAGRDVALVGMLWFAPWYPAAFSVYNVAS